MLCRKMSVRKPFGNRKFYSLPEEYHLKGGLRSRTHGKQKNEETNKLVKYIDENIIGKNTTFSGPYGRRKVVYCDYAASGRSLQFIEDFILKEVLPSYGNTHTTTSITSLQSTLFRHEARDIFRNICHASEHDAVIFAGHGCTGAVHKLLHALALDRPPIVFVGPCEHHSNLLPWRETGAQIIRIAETREGHLDLADLERNLEAYRDPSGPQMIGCFSAASNVTGVLADDIATTLLLHQYGALAFWDYATAAPYIPLDMNPVLPGIDERAVSKDAMFFSVHKFIGGVQTPGVLIAKKSLFNNSVPNGCGGGTVFFVSRDSHRYLQDTELREEGGTAAVVESVRAGLAMQLKEAVGVHNIISREERISKMVVSHMRNIPEIVLLGPATSNRRLPIFSFLVRHPRGAFLHHNFVCAVLNDVFGIQARGGCACAGPYALDLLGIGPDLANEYEDILLEDSRLDRRHLRRREEHSPYEMLRPGFARISLPYFMSDSEVGFILEAVKMVATEAWKLLPQYILNPETGEWRHHTNSVFRERRWLGSIRYTDGRMSIQERRISGQGSLPPQDNSDILHTARNIFNRARRMAQRCPLADQGALFDDKSERLRWFMLPSEAQDLLLGHSSKVKHTVPFEPIGYHGSPRTLSLTPESGTTSPIPFTSRPRCSSLGSALLPFSNENISTIARLRHLSSTESECHSLPVTINNEIQSTSMICPNDKINISKESLESKSPKSLPPGSPQRPSTPGSGSEFSFKGSYFYRPRIMSCTEIDFHSSRNGSSHAHFRPRQSSSSFSEPDSPQPTEDLQAYVQEVTKELATEIKSEIREVITTVEDVLSDGFESGPRRQEKDSVSASDVADYLVEVSRGMASELRGIVTEALTSDCNTSSYNTNGSNNDVQPQITSGSHDSGINMTGPDSDPASDSTSKTNKNKMKENKESTTQDTSTKLNVQWHCPPKIIWKPTVDAIQEFDMIRDGDRVLVCLSGGKDSLSLLHTLRQYQRYSAAKLGICFDIGAATVDPGSAAYDPSPLVPYLKALGVPYAYEQQQILEQAMAASCSSVCSFCSRLKRGRLYASARRGGYNVLALGQHLDDLAESFLMSTFHNGRLRSMKAHYYVQQRDLRVIRPFVYVREKSLRQFAESRSLPVIPENCPACFEAPKERHRTKQLLAQQEILFPKLFWSLRSALHPLISFRNTGEESRVFSRPRRRAQQRAKSVESGAESSGTGHASEFEDTDEEAPPPS